MDQYNETGEKQVGLIGQLYEQTKHMTEAERQRFLATITTQNAYRVMAPLLQAYSEDMQNAAREAETGIKAESMSLEELKRYLSDAELSGKSFNEQWEIISDTINRAWSRELQRLNAAIGTVGETASGALLPLVRTVGDIAIGFRAWAIENPKTFSTLVSIVTIVGGLLAVLGPLGFVLGQTLQGFIAVGGILRGAFIPIVMILGGSIGSALGWIAALGAAVIVLVNAWRNNWLGLTPVIEKVVGFIKTALGGLLSITLNMIQVIGALFEGDWQKAWDLFADVALTALALMSLYFDRIIVNMYGWGINLIGSLASGMIDGAKAVLSAVLTGIGEMIASFFRGFSPPKEGPLSTIDRWGENVMGAYADGIRKGARTKVKPAAEEAAKAMSMPLEGHSPAKEGPLSEIGRWGTNLMDAMLRGFKKADFSILNEAASLVSNYLKSALDAKKITPEGFISGMREIRSAIVSMLDGIRRGGELAYGAFDRIRAVVGDLSDDIQNVITAYADVMEAQEKLDGLKKEQDSLKAQRENDYDAPRKALEEETRDLEITRFGWEQKKQNIEDAVYALEKTKWPLQDELVGLEASIDSWKEKIALIEQAKVPIQDIADSIQEEIDAHREVRDSIGAELNVAKEINDERLEGLRLALDTANAVLKGKQKQDKKEEEVLERRIAEYRERGVAPYYINKLEAQLRKLRDSHEDENEALEDAKDAADEELEKAERKARLEERAIEKRLSAVEKEIAIDEKRLKVEQDKLKTLDKQIAVFNKEITNEERRESNIQRELTAIDRAITVEERKNRNLEDETKVIDKRLAEIAQEKRLLEQKNRPLLNEIESLDKQIEAADKVLSAAQDRLEIEQAIAKLHEDARQNAESASGGGGAGGGGGWDLGLDDELDALKLGKTLDEFAEEFRNKLKEMFGLASEELEAEKARIQSKIKEIFNLPQEWFDEQVGKFKKFWQSDLPLVIAFGPFAPVVRDVLDVGIGGVINGWKEALKTAWNNFWHSDLPMIISTAAGPLGPAVNALLHLIWGSGIIGDWFDDLKEAWSKFWSKTIPDALTDAWNTIVDTVKKVFGAAKDKAEEILDELKKRFGEILGTNDQSGIRGIVKNAFNSIESAINTVYTPIQNAIGWFGNLFESAKSALGMSEDASGGQDIGYHHSGGWITNDEIAQLQKGEFIVNRSLAQKLTDTYGAGWPEKLLTGLSMPIQVGITSAVRNATPTRAVQSAPIILQVGTLVADDRGLTKLEQKLKQFRDVRSARTS
jgi:hypothetical protein